MKTRDAVNKFSNNILYYLKAENEKEKMYHESNMLSSLKDIFAYSFNSNELEVRFDVRKQINSSFNDVIVIGKLDNYRDKKDGAISFFTKNVPNSYVVSFAYDCDTKYDADTITALVLYGFSVYLTTYMKQRTRAQLYHIIEKYSLDPESKEINQLTGVLYYINALKLPYLAPTDDFTTSATLDMLYFLSPAIYNAYARFFSKNSKMYHELYQGTKKDHASPTGESPIYYIKDSVEINNKIIDDMMKDDKKQALFITRVANDGLLDQELDDIHEMSKIRFKLKDILSSDNRANVILMDDEVLTENFKRQSEFRYRLDKIIIGSKYIDTEDERTSLLVEIYSLKSKLFKQLEKEERILSNAKTKQVEMDQAGKIEYIKNMLDEIGAIQALIVNSDLKPKKFGVFIEYPAGYSH